MDHVQKWALGICLTVLVNAMVQYMIPRGSMERMLRFVVGGIVLCGLMVPFTELSKIDWTWEEPVSARFDYDGFPDEVQRQIFQQAERNIQQVVITELEKNGYGWKNVSVRMDTNPDGSIVIEQVVVTVDKETLVHRDELTTRLEKNLGLKTEVVWDGESG